MSGVVPVELSLHFEGDSATGLVAFALGEDGGTLRVWRREGADTTVDTVAFSPFLLATTETACADAAGLIALERLQGPGALAWCARFATWAAALAARERCQQASGQPPGAVQAPYRCFTDAVHQYLLTSGRTSFRSLRFGEVRRLALDIEVVTSEGHEFPSAARFDDRVVAIALADTTGFRHVLRGDRMDERTLLTECVRLVRDRDPDVIEGHNIFRFDLEYLEARARMHGVTLAFGRDGSPLRGRPARLQVAERGIGYRRYEVAGRHVVDTWMLAQLHDVGARDLPSFGLKDIARHLGVTAPGRTYVDAGDIAGALREDADRLMAYAADDAVETLAVSAVLSPPYFAQAQVLPLDYQSCTLRGTAAKIDALLVREHLAAGRAIPLPGAPGPVGGGLTAIWRQGVARPALHVDVTSLYPSLMLADRIAPAADDLGVFLPLLARLTDYRVAAKRRARAAGSDEERREWTAQQACFKILINSFYGYLAFARGHWNDFAAADRVTAAGRAVVTAIIERLETLGALPLEADTDGVYFVPPPGRGDDETLLAEVATALPSGVSLELDGRFAAMFSYKMKTYALLDDRDRVLLKGSAFRSRGLEPFQRQLIEEIVRLLLLGRARDVKATIDRWIGDFAGHRVPVRLFARTETLGDTIETYRERVTSGQRPPSAAYELALAAARAVQPGDQISYYVAGRGVRVPVNEQARLASAWDPGRPDENVEYYQAKVLDVWQRFRRFVELDGLAPYVEDEPPAQLSLF